MSQPQLILTLSPSGNLVAELPGLNGSRRRLDLKPGEAEATLRRILEAQARHTVALGEDGAPTQAQIAHWEHAASGGSPTCAFCRSAGLFKSKGWQPEVPKAPPIKLSEGISVRRRPPEPYVLVQLPDEALPTAMRRSEARRRGLRPLTERQSTTKSLQELGF